MVSGKGHDKASFAIVLTSAGHNGWKDSPISSIVFAEDILGFSGAFIFFVRDRHDTFHRRPSGQASSHLSAT